MPEATTIYCIQGQGSSVDSIIRYHSYDTNGLVLPYVIDENDGIRCVGVYLRLVEGDIQASFINTTPISDIGTVYTQVWYTKQT
jgi:hypothetical protein